MRKSLYPDGDGILEYDPVYWLLAASCGQGAVIMEILVHQDRKEVHYVHIWHCHAFPIIRKLELYLIRLSEKFVLKMLLDARNPFVKTLSLDWWESFRKFLPKCPCWDGRAGLLQQPRGETRLSQQTVFTQMLIITWNLNPKTVRPFSCSRASETSSSWMFLWTMWSSIGYLT